MRNLLAGAHNMLRLARYINEISMRIEASESKWLPKFNSE